MAHVGYHYYTRNYGPQSPESHGNVIADIHSL